MKKQKVVSTPEGTPERLNLLAGTKLIEKKGILDIYHFGKNKCKYARLVHATVQVPHGEKGPSYGTDVHGPQHLIGRGQISLLLTSK